MMGQNDCRAISAVIEDGLHGLVDLVEWEGFDWWRELDLFGYA